MNLNPNEIRHFEGYTPILEKPRELLPVGGYICKIIKSKVENRTDGSQEMDIMLEIAEGPYTGFYRRDYDAQNPAFPQRYHGIYRIICPTDNLRPEDSWRLDKFNLTLGAIVDSNPGYVWNWDASSLIGLTVGISVRENEYRGAIYTEIGKLIPIYMIRNGNFRPMRRRVSREDGSTIVQGYPPVTTNHSAPVSTSETPAMTHSPEGYTASQGQVVPTSQQPRFGSSALDNKYSQVDDLPF